MGEMIYCFESENHSETKLLYKQKTTFDRPDYHKEWTTRVEAVFA
jgi:hypothetical protein